MSLKYKVENVHGFARSGSLRIRHKTLKTPAFWIRHIAKSKPEPWKDSSINTIATNLYSFFKHKKDLEAISKKGIHNYLGKDRNQTFIMMDAAGFVFRKRSQIPFEVNELFQVYQKSRPDLGVVLEHPLNLTEEEKENRSRIESTLNNTKLMLEKKSQVYLMPVVLGYSPKTLEYVSNSLKKIALERNLEITILGVSSVLPFVKTEKINRVYMDFWRDSAERTGAHSRKIGIRIVATIRKNFPNSFLHCFGTGGTNLMHILFFLGVDSVDSIGWRLAPCYGSIEIFGKGQRYVSTKRYNVAQWATNISPSERKALDECECPACKIEGSEGLVRSFHNRAVHSAFVYYQEADEARKLISEGRKEYERYLKNRFKGTRLYSLFLYVLQKHTILEALDKFT